MTLVSRTKLCLPPLMAAGTLITRGSTRGTLTMAMRLSRPSASLPDSRAMKCSDLLATCGNGCAGSRPTGTSSGRTSRSKNLLTHARISSVRSAWLRIWMLCSRKAGMTWSLKIAYCWSIRSWAARPTRSTSRGVTRPLPSRCASSMSAKRTSKNSSRLLDTMQM